MKLTPSASQGVKRPVGAADAHTHSACPARALLAGAEGTAASGSTPRPRPHPQFPGSR